MLAAGLLAKKAAERGLRVPEHVKTSLTPGSRVVAVYLEQAGLQPYLDQLGFQVAGFGCATCMGNSGPLAPWVEEAIAAERLVVASVLSGNRNFEARIHQAIKANYLMSPPLVVAYALAGRIDIDMASQPLGLDAQGAPVFLRDLWPTPQELAQVLPHAQNPVHFHGVYDEMARSSTLWNELQAPQGEVYSWQAQSSYLREPPFFRDFAIEPPPLAPIRQARALALLGDSVTTDHISPGGEIGADSDAGRFLASLGVKPRDFNSYIARRAHDGVMMRGTFASTRMKNLMLPGIEGGLTLHQPSGQRMSIHDAAMAYQSEGVPSIVIAGEEYGTGSSRDWAAKGPKLLGVRAVIARSFERIHRSNLIGMGILPCQFQGQDSLQSLQLDGSERFDIVGLENGVRAQQTIELRITHKDGRQQSVTLLARVDTPIEERYLQHGGILPFVLRKLIRSSQAAHV